MAVVLSFAVVVKEAQLSVEDEGRFNELAKEEAAHRLAVSTMITEGEEGEGDADLVGKTMTSRNGTVIPLSTSGLTGL